MPTLLRRYHIKPGHWEEFMAMWLPITLIRQRFGQRDFAVLAVDLDGHHLLLFGGAFLGSFGLFDGFGRIVLGSGCLFGFRNWGNGFPFGLGFTLSRDFGVGSDSRRASQSS